MEEVSDVEESYSDATDDEAIVSDVVVRLGFLVRLLVLDDVLVVESGVAEVWK